MFSNKAWRGVVLLLVLAYVIASGIAADGISLSQLLLNIILMFLTEGVGRGD